MSPELKQFLTKWLEWVEAGAPEHPIFKRCDSLCFAIRIWIRNDAALKHHLGDELKSLLRKTTGVALYPFNDLKYLLYAREVFEKRCHLNQARVQWVRDQLKRN